MVRYNIPQINEEFAETCRLLWQYAQINLLDVAVDEAGVLTPSFIVLEPDYLLDISSLAECFRDYGHHPANYVLSRLQPIENARPLLLGNIANLFLDEWIHAQEEEIDYRACMQKAFRRYPIELAACPDLRDKEKERRFSARNSRREVAVRASKENIRTVSTGSLSRTPVLASPVLHREIIIRNSSRKITGLRPHMAN